MVSFSPRITPKPRVWNVEATPSPLSFEKSNPDKNGKAPQTPLQSKHKGREDAVEENVGHANENGNENDENVTPVSKKRKLEKKKFSADENDANSAPVLSPPKKKQLLKQKSRK